jgi:NodT family efflux transporter outer membrane factor (OMF) lipoprotein
MSIPKTRYGRRRSALAGAAAVLVAATALLAGCTAGPDYHPPEPEVPDAWETAVVEELYSDSPPLTSWWTVLEDTLLTSLLRRAEMSNLNLAAAVARVEEARALRGVARGDYVPHVDLRGTFSRTQPAENDPALQGLPPDQRAVPPVNFWDTSLNASWEIDVFGRVRRSVEAASAELGASIEDFRDVLVSLYAEVALSYVETRAIQERLAFAYANVRAQRQTLKLTQDRFDTGLTTALDVAQAESNLANSEAAIPSFQSDLNAAMNRLAVLLAQAPGALDAELAPLAPIPVAPDSVTVGLPAELLRRRPDVRRAERRLAAQTARIGVAASQYYPSFSLTGFLTLQSQYFSDLGESSAFGWGFIPGLRWNLFQGGKIRGQVRAEEARTQQLLYAYEQTVLIALEEVENTMVAYERERVRRDRLQRAVNATQRSVELVHTQYISGLTNFQNYLDAQRSLFDQQDQLAVSEGRVVTNLIRLQRALGGGWLLDAPDPDRAEETETTPEP